MYFILKTVISALLIAGISEAGKRFTTLGAVLASLPLTSLLAFIWLYIETKNVEKVSSLSWEIFYMVIPSLSFFIALPLLLKHLKFYPSLLIAAAITAVAYFLWMMVIRKVGLIP